MSADNKKKKRKKWVSPRHKAVSALLYPIMWICCKIRYGIKIERAKNRKRSYLVLCNHQTAFDQFFMGLAFFPEVLYYVASEDLFSKGWISRLIRYLVAPIPIKKQTTDVSAVLNCIRVAREGGSIAIAPEGNRTYSGETTYIKPSIAALARALKLPIAFFRIEGGYGVHPRWSDVVRRGKMRAYVSRIVEADEIAALSDDELFRMIEKELYVNEAEIHGSYRSNKSAEYLERAMYVCPDCGLSVFHSKGELIECLTCHKKIRYTESCELVGCGFDFPFRHTTEWYRYQCDFIRALPLDGYLERPMYIDTVKWSEIIPYKERRSISATASISLFGDRIAVYYDDEKQILPFSEIGVITVLGRNKLNIYHKDTLYQVKGDKRFNPIKYMNIYYASKKNEKGDEHAGFLGI